MSRVQRRKNFWGYLFITPNFIGFIAFLLFPIFASLFYGFTNYDVISSTKFIGFDNYVGLFTDRRFITALINTIYYSLLTVPAGIILAILTAVLFNKVIKGIGIFRTFIFIPVITSLVSVSLVWSMLYEENAGLLNVILNAIGLPSVKWLTDPNMAMISIAIMSIWKGLGYNMTIFIAGLQGIPGDLYEAATIDGANARQRFFRITLPMLGPTTYFVSLMALISSLQVFDSINIMTNGGPIDSTTTIAMYLFQYGFRFYKMGYACSAAYILFIIVFVFSMIQSRSSARWTEATV